MGQENVNQERWTAVDRYNSEKLVPPDESDDGLALMTLDLFFFAITMRSFW